MGVVGYDNRVLVADTNHHRLLLVDTTRQDAWTVSVQGLALPTVDTGAAAVADTDLVAAV